MAGELILKAGKVVPVLYQGKSYAILVIIRGLYLLHRLKANMILAHSKYLDTLLFQKNIVNIIVI